MRLMGECIQCIFESHWALVKDCPDEDRKLEFLQAVSRTLSEADPKMSAPIPTARLQALYAQMFPESDHYAELKHAYNELLLAHAPALRERIARADDPLRLAVWMAIAGNYIDFGVLKEVDDDRLMEMIATPDDEALDPRELRHLRDDLAKAEALVYCLDNSGEIVLDLLLMEVIRRDFPQIGITALVRGAPVLNDVTAEDAHFVGVDRVARIIGNGSNIGGTQLELLSDEALDAVRGADVVISKGQGNFETLTGTGLNAYYLLLSKCKFYKRWFGMEHMRAQLLNERRFSVDNGVL